ncbi:hypothetical protein QJV45_09685 [Listeria booriae]|uniref:hypothetical protein n=1 Tax=Listeria booriae TaxID=1552123 RepID=UPI0028806A54|nr:hypothetical protein [Listeria booriae]MDT0110737.1 hypothetical protein [Listeria booriae]
MKKWLFASVSIAVIVLAIFMFSDKTKANDTANLNIGTMGAYEINSDLFTLHKINKKNMSSYDALLITKDYINDSSQNELRTELNKSKLPLLFVDFEDESALAFLTTELPLKDIEMVGKGEIQMVYTLPNGEHATFALFDQDESSLQKLDKAINLVQKVSSLEEWEEKSVLEFSQDE